MTGLEGEIELRIKGLADTKVAPITVGELRELLEEIEQYREDAWKYQDLSR